MLTKDEVYNHDLYQKSDPPPINRLLTPEQAFELLRKQGYQITEAVV